MFLLRLRAWSSYVHFLAYYDGDDFCGFTYTVENEDMVFVLYLAVNDEIRSKGYGTAILTDLKARASGRGVALNIEPLDPHAANSEQRERRLEFYRRNGFVSTDYNLIDGGDQVSYLVHEGRFSGGGLYPGDQENFLWPSCAEGGTSEIRKATGQKTAVSK